MTETRIEAELKSAITWEPLVELASEMIRIPSVSPRDAEDCQRIGIEPGEEALARMLAERLERSGLEVTLQEVVPGRPNLVARLRGEGQGPSLCLNAHMDTVGAYEMRDRAFHPEVCNGRLYGRGAVDDKGPLACFVLVLEAFARRGISLAGDLLLTAVIGEEGPPSGTRHLVESGFRVDGVIIGEASELGILVGQRGAQFVRLQTNGRTAHGSMPQAGVNAIDGMIRLLASVPSMPLFSGPGEPYGTSTFSVGTIHGGVRTNIVPDQCVCTIDVRTTSEVSPDDVFESFRRQMAALEIQGTVEAEDEPHPAYMTSKETRLVQVALQASTSLGLLSNLGLAPYWTDMAYLSPVGIPTVIIGPGSVLRAHSAEEYVEIDQLLNAAHLYAYIALLFCGRSP